MSYVCSKCGKKHKLVWQYDDKMVPAELCWECYFDPIKMMNRLFPFTDQIKLDDPEGIAAWNAEKAKQQQEN